MSIYPSWLGTYGTSTGECVEVLPLLRTGNRPYTTRRVAIADALAVALKGINGTHPFDSDLEGRVHSTPRFLDDINEFPEVHIETGFETRKYQGGGFKDRFLPIKVKCFVNDPNSSDSLGLLLEDLETILEDNGRIGYYDRENVLHHTYKLSILSISTEELNSPLMLGEINCEIHY